MRKFLIIIVLFSIVSLAFGQEQGSANDFNFGLSCLIAVSDKAAAPGPGLAAAWYNTRLFGPLGVGAHFNFVMPIVKTDFDYSNMGLAASLLAGPAYMIYDNGVFALPLTAGAHFDFVVGFGDTTTTAINLGAGAGLDFLWRFGKKWHAYARLLAVYNFGGGGEFLAFPGLGIGFSF